MNKLNIKLYRIVVIIIAITFVGKTEIYSLSEDFLFAINTVGIPRYNVNKEEINEDVYNAYQVFAYSSPTKIYSGQSFCSSKFGFWTKGGGPYKGSGTRGEYLLVGKTYSGDVIHNLYYPIVKVPNTTPDTWNYLNDSSAANSWKDKSKYESEEQLNYMKTTKLMFNDVLDKENVNNPKYMKEYNITATKIGLGKAKLDTSSTWRTYGIVHASRLVDGTYRHVIFFTNKLSGNADIQNNIDVTKEITMSKNDDEIYIPITYLAQVINMTGFAKSDHIKEIVSDLYINDKKVDSVNGSKITSVGNTYMLVVTRKEVSPNSNNYITILVDSYMYTEFAVDGLIRKRTSETLQINVEEKAPKQIESKNLKNLSKQNTWVVSPFAQTLISNENKGAVGVTEAGKYIAARIPIDLTYKLDSVYIDNQKVSAERISTNNVDVQIIKIKIPVNTKSTIYGAKSLRDTSRKLFRKQQVDRKQKINTTYTKYCIYKRNYKNRIYCTI